MPRTWFHHLAFLSGVWMALHTHAALAQSLPCAPREQVLEGVMDHMGAERLARGRAARGAQIEVFSTPDGDWMIVLQLPDGRACLLGAGDQFEATLGLQPARGAPA